MLWNTGVLLIVGIVSSKFCSKRCHKTFLSAWWWNNGDKPPFTQHTFFHWFTSLRSLCTWYTLLCLMTARWFPSYCTSFVSFADNYITALYIPLRYDFYFEITNCYKLLRQTMFTYNTLLATSSFSEWSGQQNFRWSYNEMHCSITPNIIWTSDDWLIEIKSRDI